MHAHTMTVATQHGQARLTTPPSSSSWNLSLSDADPAAADVSRVRSACAIMLPGIIPCSPARALSLLLSPPISSSTFPHFQFQFILLSTNKIISISENIS